MAPHTATPEPVVQPAPSASGARIDTIAVAEAPQFLDRMGERLPPRAELAWGAREDNGALIGVAVSSPGATQAEAIVAVLPARQRLGVGRDLAHVLLDDVRHRGLGYLGCWRPDGSTGPAEFLRALGLVASRRTADGAQRIVAVVPAHTT